MKNFKIISFISLLTLIVAACSQNIFNTQSAAPLPHEARWGIYSLNLSNQEVELFYSSPNEITKLRLDPTADQFAFSQKADGDTDEDFEIFTLGVDGHDLQRLTNNNFLDSYPAWSPDGSQIAYLAWPDSTLDIHIMAKDGSQSIQFYDSGDHDADIDLPLQFNNFRD